MHTGEALNPHLIFLSNCRTTKELKPTAIGKTRYVPSYERPVLAGVPVLLSDDPFWQGSL